jgi:glycosyltransferase involved in cell wall biosynthesis
MPNAARLAVALDATLGWRTVSENWKNLYPQNSPLALSWIAFDSLTPANRRQFANKTLQRTITRLNMGVAVNRQMRDLAPDVALVGNMALNLVQAKKGTPIFTVLDATQKQLQAFGSGYGIYPAKSRVLENIKHRMRRRHYRACAGIFAFSDWAGRSLVADYGVDPRKVHVLPHGAVVERWPRRTREEKSGEICNILFVGGDFKRKGGEFLLNWAARTRDREWRMHIVTRDKIETTDERITVHNGMAPADPRLTELFAEADIFALPTLVDTSPLVIAEAFAAGLPVISSDVAAIPEMITQGVTGFAIPLTQTKRWEECLDLLIRDRELRRRMGAAARQDAEHRFDARKNIRIAVDLIASTLKARRP